MPSLKSLVPVADDLLSLGVEDLAGVLLTHLNSNDNGNPAIQHDGIIQYNFFNNLRRITRDYPGREDEVNRALMEAWNWLEGEGLLVRDAETPFSEKVFLSRRARRLQTREDFGAYRKANLLPKGQLHKLIATRVYPAFLRGDYDTAVFQAFREVEVAVRNAGNFRDEDVGTTLMRDAFRPGNPEKPAVTPGPLTDITLPVAEQEGMAHLFAGAIAVYKNPQSHRNVPTRAIRRCGSNRLRQPSTTDG
jgi:uncharacterized protein (TIGR02391 family)